jgi:hypothetical protein
MDPIPKFLVALGLALVALGLVWQFGSRYLQLGHLPGDIVIERDGTRIYLPIVTCVVLSIVLSLLLTLWRWLSR